MTAPKGRRRLSPAGEKLARRQSAGAKGTAAYEEATAAERVGDHAITPERVAGASAPARRTVRIDAKKGPAAAAIIADLLTVQWAVVRGLRDAQESRGTLDEGQIETLVKISDSVTKVLREERRQNDLDDWSRLSQGEIIETLPGPMQSALAGLLGEGDEEETGHT